MAARPPYLNRNAGNIGVNGLLFTGQIGLLQRESGLSTREIMGFFDPSHYAPRPLIQPNIQSFLPLNTQIIVRGTSLHAIADGIKEIEEKTQRKTPWNGSLRKRSSLKSSESASRFHISIL